MKTIYTDRSRYVDGLNCSRLRYLGYEHNGRGITPMARPSYFEVGTTVHEVLERLIVNPVKETATRIAQELIWSFMDKAEQFSWPEEGPPLDLSAKEQATWIEAVMWAWLEVRVPAILDEYEIVAIEKELEYSLGYVHEMVHAKSLGYYSTDVVWLSRPDIILRRKSDKLLYVMDLKTMKQARIGDLDRNLAHSVLVQGQMAAVEHCYGEPVGGFLLEGILKGAPRMDNRLGYKRYYSPLTWAYTSGVEDGLVSAKTSHDNYRLGPPVLLSDLSSISIEQYVNDLPREVKAAQFVQPEPIGVNPLMVERWRRYVLTEEQSRIETIEATATMNTDHCYKYTNSYPCQFVSACFDEAVRDDPVGSGLYTKRIPNHETELLIGG